MWSWGGNRICQENQHQVNFDQKNQNQNQENNPPSHPPPGFNISDLTQLIIATIEQVLAQIRENNAPLKCFHEFTFLFIILWTFGTLRKLLFIMIKYFSQFKTCPKFYLMVNFMIPNKIKCKKLSRIWWHKAYVERLLVLQYIILTSRLVCFFSPQWISSFYVHSVTRFSNINNTNLHF